MTLYQETLCEHGELLGHRVGRHDPYASTCPGGSRSEVPIDPQTRFDYKIMIERGWNSPAISHLLDAIFKPPDE